MALLLLLTAMPGWATPRSKAQMREAAREAINQHRGSRHMAPSRDTLKVFRSMEQLEIIGFESGGFAVVTSDDLMPAVMGVSLNRYSGGKNLNFEGWLLATADAVQQAVEQQTPLQVTQPDPTKYPLEVPMLVQTKWDQEGPYNRMCPTYSGSVKCLTGCVATAMAQVLNYHKTPVHGIGERTIYYGSQAVTAHFEDDYYDWDNMLDRYIAGAYNEEQANAVAMLMRDCGVAANMKYGGPYEGSGAYSEDMVQGLREYFGYENAELLYRNSYSESEWMNFVYTELSQRGPILYGGYDTMGGHQFVLDGYNAEGQVSVNWGWSGDDDGMFFISQLNGFNYGQDMVVGIESENGNQLRNEVVVVTAGGQLREILENSDKEGIVSVLTVEGPLNDEDLLYVRYLAGRDEQGEPTDGMLRVLDLTKANLQSNILPDSLFMDCTSLYRIRLPETIESIGTKAFYGCSSLAELRVTCKYVPTLLGEDVFAGMPLGRSKLYVMRGLKKQYSSAEQWKDFTDANIIETGVSVKVRNAIRYYGERNPSFTYTVTGGQVEGSPYMTCNATKASPAGRYPIYISAGSIVNSEACNFVDGYLIVQKVDAKATVENCERFEGEENPTFTLRYDGLIEKEDAPTWIEGPVFSTMATPQSKPGEYTVYVVSGEAESYNMVFLPGKLTVKERPVPSGIKEVDGSTTDAPVYNLQGQRVEKKNKGLYLVGGKKYVER